MSKNQEIRDAEYEKEKKRRQRLRKDGLLPKLVSLDYLNYEVASPTNVENEVLKSMSIKNMWRQFNEMFGEENAYMLWAYYELGYTDTEIANKLNIERRTLTKRRNKIIKIVRKSKDVFMNDC